MVCGLRESSAESVRARASEQRGRVTPLAKRFDHDAEITEHIGPPGQITSKTTPMLSTVEYGKRRL
eukprot:3940477-Rhodomonas_salina.4